jgi:TPR repeat protein
VESPLQGIHTGVRPTSAPPSTRRRRHTRFKKKKSKKRNKNKKDAVPLPNIIRPLTAPSTRRNHTINNIDVFRNPNDAYSIGQMHTTKKDRKAIQYFILAAEQGHQRSQFSLSMMFKKQGNVSRCKSILRQIIQIKSAVQAKAMVELGDIYQNEANLMESVALYQLSANLNYAVGQFRIGKCYIEGIGIKKNKLFGTKYLERSAQQNYIDAQIYLGCYYFNQSKDSTIDKNYRKKISHMAVHWWKIAANYGSKEGQYYLAMAELNYYGGCKRDESYIAKLFLLSAKQNHVKSQIEIAKCYYYGIGIKKDYKLAAKYYRIAGNNGSKKALKCLQAMHKLNLDMPSNYPIGLRNYKVTE